MFDQLEIQCSIYLLKLIQLMQMYGRQVSNYFLILDLNLEARIIITIAR